MRRQRSEMTTRVAVAERGDDRAMWLWVLVLLSAVLLGTLGCGAGRSGGDEQALAQEAIDSDVLKAKLGRMGLEELWEFRLPLVRGHQVERLFYHEGRLYVLTDGNFLFAVEDDGTIAGTEQLSDALPTCLGPTSYEDRLVFTLGKTLVEVRASNLERLRDLELPYPITTAAVRSANRIYLGNDKSVFYCLRYEDGTPMWWTNCPDKPVGEVGLVGLNVHFACQDGTLLTSRAAERKLMWQHKSAGAIAGFALADDEIYVGGEETAFYAMNAEHGTPLWPERPRLLVGGPMSQTPVVTADAVYQVIDQEGLLCLNRADGSQRWRLPDGVGLLAENGAVTYAMTGGHEVVAMNNKTGRRMMGFYSTDYRLYASNNEDSLVFLACRGGRLLALKPARVQ